MAPKFPRSGPPANSPPPHGNSLGRRPGARRVSVAAEHIFSKVLLSFISFARNLPGTSTNPPHTTNGNTSKRIRPRNPRLPGAAPQRSTIAATHRRPSNTVFFLSLTMEVKVGVKALHFGFEQEQQSSSKPQCSYFEPAEADFASCKADLGVADKAWCVVRLG